MTKRSKNMIDKVDFIKTRTGETNRTQLLCKMDLFVKIDKLKLLGILIKGSSCDYRILHTPTLKGTNSKGVNQSNDKKEMNIRF